MWTPTNHKTRDILVVGGGGGSGRGSGGEGGGVETSCWGVVELSRIEVIIFMFFLFFS